MRRRSVIRDGCGGGDHRSSSFGSVMRATLLVATGAFSGIMLYVGARRSHCFRVNSSSSTTTTAEEDEGRSIVTLLKWPGGIVPTQSTMSSLYPSSWSSTFAATTTSTATSNIPDMYPQDTSLFAGLPPESRKTFYNECGKGCHPFVRALRETGWQKVNAMEHGRLLLTWDKVNMEWLTQNNELESWQRYSHLPSTKTWSSWAQNRDTLITAAYDVCEYFPPTYQMHDEKDREALGKLLDSKKHAKYIKTQPWVFYADLDEDYDVEEASSEDGQFPTLIPPSEISKKHLPSTGVLSKYICRPLRWGRSGRKFDVRVYFFVATLDPLVVLFHDGFIQTSMDPYEEGSYTSIQDRDVHLMNYKFKHEMSKHSFDDLEAMLRLSKKKVPPKIKELGIMSPFQHVRNQMKEAVAQVVHGLAPTAFDLSNNNNHDGWELFAADFIIDEDLDVWLVSANDDITLHEDIYSNLGLAHDVYTSMIRILEDVWSKQEQQSRQRKSILPLDAPGKFELIYVSDADRKQNFMYNYAEYDRDKATKKKKKPCAKVRK